MLRIGQPLLQENQDKPVDSLGGAAPVANERNDQGTKKKIRPVRIIFTDADQKKKILAALRETINESRSSKYKYIFFQQDLTWKQREITKEKRAAASEIEKEQRVMRAQQGSRGSLFHN